MAEHDINDRRLEEMLDAMLNDYSGERPRPGLETRVLATLREQSRQEQDRAPLWRWLWGGAAAMALVAVVLAVYIARLQAPPAPPAVSRVMKPPPVATPTVSRDRADRTADVRRVRHQQAQEPVTALTPPLAMAARQEVFPSPVPLTDQEKLLLRYLRHTSQEEVVAQSHSDDPAPEDGGQLPPHVREFRSTDVFSTR
jgi:hypothetical protein